MGALEFTYQIRNNPFQHEADDYEGQFGLVTTAWDEKPALSAMEAYSAVMRARNNARRKGRGEQVDEPFFALGQSFAHIPPTGGNGY